MTLDPRLNPFRDEIAAKHLQGQVEAKSFVHPDTLAVAVPVTDMLGEPGAEGRTSQALYGERFDVYEEREGWAWGQLATDGYVGWIKARHLMSLRDDTPTHLVSALLTRATPTSIKTLGFGPLPMGSQVAVLGDQAPVAASSAPFLQTSTGAIPEAHLKPMDQVIDDWVAVAEMYLGSPYVWGGRSSLGLDCSALVQLALQQAGIDCLRDSDLQESGLGKTLERRDGLQRGDLVFWAGHVGIMVDSDMFVHANAWHMAVAKEPLADAEARIGPVRMIKRL
ncbi:MAG: C40 family peptidase [Pseudomonadota bacterium]